MLGVIISIQYCTVKFIVLNLFVFSGSDDFLGQASVTMDDLRRLPSSRQIIPLTGRPRATTSTSGSVTVEVSSSGWIYLLYSIIIINFKFLKQDNGLLSNAP